MIDDDQINDADQRGHGQEPLFLPVATGNGSGGEIIRLLPTASYKRRGCGGLHRVDPPDQIGWPTARVPLQQQPRTRARAPRWSGGGRRESSGLDALAQSRKRVARVSPARGRGRTRQGGGADQHGQSSGLNKLILG
eukprot:4853165-Pleurochrysis_carterae.AAC.6